MAQASNPALSGRAGTVKHGASPTAFAHVSMWKLKRTSELAKYVSSDTGGYTRREKGPMDMTGSFSCKVPKGQEAFPITQGDGLDIVLMRDSTSTANWAGYVFVSSIEEEIDVETGKIISYAVEFEADGALTYTEPA